MVAFESVVLYREMKDYNRKEKHQCQNQDVLISLVSLAGCMNNCVVER